MISIANSSESYNSQTLAEEIQFVLLLLKPEVEEGPWVGYGDVVAKNKDTENIFQNTTNLYFDVGLRDDKWPWAEG